MARGVERVWVCVGGLALCLCAVAAAAAADTAAADTAADTAAGTAAEVCSAGEGRGCAAALPTAPRQTASSSVFFDPTLGLYGMISAFIEEVFRALMSQVHNQFVSGTLVLTVSGSLIAAFTLTVRNLYRWVSNAMWSTVIIKDMNQMAWVLKWLTLYGKVDRQRQVVLSLAVKDAGGRQLGRSRIDPRLLNPDAPAFLPLFEPAANAIAMTVRINGKKVYVRVVEEMKGDSHERYTQRHLELKAMSRSKQFAVDLLSKAYLHHMESLKSVTTVRTTKTFGTQVRWVEAQTRPSRPMDTIIFNGNEGQILLDDVSDFLASEAFYVARGLAYRRGYLAYGPPGCGKSSFVLALAGSLKLPVCVMNLSDPALTDSTLIDLLSTAPSPSIVLLEDIDAAFTKSKSTGGDDPEPDSGRGGGPNRSMQSKSLTFSGLLNALDGAAAQEGKVVFMSSNHPELLDPALVRPGRVDLKVRFSRATADAASRLFKRFYLGCPAADDVDDLSKQFASFIPDGKYSMAQIQGLLMKHKKDPHAVVAALKAGIHSAMTDVVDRDATDGSVASGDSGAGAGAGAGARAGRHVASDVDLLPPAPKLLRSQSVPGSALADDPQYRIGLGLADGLIGAGAASPRRTWDTDDSAWRAIQRGRGDQRDRYGRTGDDRYGQGGRSQSP